MASALARHWTLDPQVTFLNHGSYGACPTAVQQAQAELRSRMESQPCRFMNREVEGLLDAARTELAAFLGADAQDLAFVRNATMGVNTVLRALELQPGDELLTTDHAYNACRNALDVVAHRAGARVVAVKVPFPLQDAAEVTERLVQAVTSRTRLLLLDHVTSATGLLLDAESIVAAMQTRGVDVLVDGAHAPGMLPLDLDRLGAAYYTGNCHKWLCAPKGSAFLHVRRDRQAFLRPLCISHGANDPRTDRSRFLLEFGWTGTEDPTPWLAIPSALRCVAELEPGGWPARMAANRRLVLAARDLLCGALGVTAPCPDSMIGSLASLPLPPGPAQALQDALMDEDGIEVPIMPWPSAPARLLRVSAQAYNDLEQYELLARALPRHLAALRA